MRLLLLIYFLLGVKSHEQEKKEADYSEHGTVVKSKELYVPLGFDATVECDALAELSSVHVDTTKVHWRRLTSTGTKKVPFSTPGSKSDERFYSTSHEKLYIFGVQMVHDGTVIECHVEHEEEAPQSEGVTLKFDDADGVQHESSANFVIRAKRTAFVSRTKIVVQNCGEGDKDKSINPLNPCMYGVCLIDNKTAFHRLECMCVEQYTGEYCDVLVKGTFWREILFYSPVLAHFLFVVLFMINQCFLAKTRKVHKTALEDIMDKSRADKIDMKKLYPAVYYEAKDLEEMTQSDEPLQAAKPKT